MDKLQRQVRNFHKVIDMPMSPAEPQIRHAELRASLIMEEAFETACALVGTSKAQSIAHQQIVDVLQKKTQAGDDGRPNIAEAIDGCIDTLVVTYGTLEEIGVDGEPFANEVMRANMAKVDGPVREDGKRLKPPGWTPPDIEGVLARVLASRVDDETRCAWCGWPLCERVEEGCTRGNCSMRPLPEILFQPERALREKNGTSNTVYLQVKRSVEWLFDQAQFVNTCTTSGVLFNIDEMSGEQLIRYACDNMRTTDVSLIACAVGEYLAEKRAVVK